MRVNTYVKRFRPPLLPLRVTFSDSQPLHLWDCILCVQVRGCCRTTFWRGESRCTECWDLYWHHVSDYNTYWHHVSDSNIITIACHRSDGEYVMGLYSQSSATDCKCRVNRLQENES